MPAEWSRHARTWMCWPCRLEAWGSADGLWQAKCATARVAQAIAGFEPVIMAARPEDASEARRICAPSIEVFEVALDDSWARDIGPSFLSGPEHAGVAWQFNAWGGKYEPYTNDGRFAAHILGQCRARIFSAPLVCEGGAIDVDGEGTLMTTEQCLLNPNRNPARTKAEIERTLAEYTGTTRILWLPGRFSDSETDGHIDNIACFAAPGRVLLGMPAMNSHPDSEAVAAARRELAQAHDAQGRELEIVELTQPHQMRLDWRGRPLAASYVNFYLANGGLVMPAFDDPADEAAREVLADCFPGRRIAQVEVLDIVQGGGGIHCITQQEPG
ncbi:MAG TPA: agmatine deiminase family protein [Rhizomicrobium sp.]|nr:agmatine deiminase family protein [Rhizomicrobium sp.]